MADSRGDPDLKAKILAAVDRTGVPYEIIEIDPAHAETAVFCETYGYPVDRSCNTILVASKKEPRLYSACCVIADTRLDVNHRVKRLMGVPKASFATADQMRALTGMEVGGVTPFALPDGVPLFVDDRIPPLDWVILGGGGRDFKIKISPEVFPPLGARIVAGLAVPVERKEP